MTDRTERGGCGRSAAPGTRVPGRTLRVILALTVGLLAADSPAVSQDEGPEFRRLMLEGQRFRSAGNTRAASARFNAALEAAQTDEGRAEALVAHAAVQRALGRDDQAEEDLRRTLALDVRGPFRRPALFQLADLLESQDRLDEAVAVFEQVATMLRDKPGEAADALLGAARVLANRARYEDARRFLDQVRTEAVPTHLRTEAAQLRAEVLIGTGDPNGAREAIEQAQVDAPQAANLYVRLARTLVNAKRLDEAMDACEAAIALQPENPAAWRTQYDIAAERGTVDALRDDLVARLNAQPDDELLVQRLASFAEWESDPDRSLTLFRQLIEVRPADANLLERAGAAASGAGRGAEAIEFYEAALKLTPHDTGLYYMMGEAYARAGQADKAVELLKKGTEFRATDPDSVRQLGMVLIRSGLYDQAIGIYGELRRTLGDPNALAYEMAEALAPVRPEAALAEYVRAASISLDDADAIAPEALALARGADLLPRLGALAEEALAASDEPGLLLLLTVVHAAQGTAEPAVRRAVEAGLAPEELLQIGESLEFEGDRDTAALIYDAVARHPEASPGLRLELGVRAAESHLAAGRLSEAETVLGLITESAAGPPHLRERAGFLLAEVALSAGHDFAGARETFASLATGASDPDLATKARWRLADCAFAAGDFEEAKALYAQLASSPPPLDLPMPPLPPGFAGGGPGVLLPRMALEESPRADPRMTPAYAHYQIAECSFRSNNLEQAKALFAEVAEKYPESVYANDAVERRLLIGTHFADPRPASETYLAALRAGSTDRWEEAIVQFRELAAQGLAEPLADDAEFLAAGLLETHGRRAEAATAFRELPVTFPGSLLAPEAQLNAARLARALGEDEQAEEDLTTLLQNSPHAPMARTAALWLDDLKHGRPWSAAP